MPLCESVWQYFWRHLTLKGPVKEWQRSRADVIRQETVTRAVMRPKYANCKGQLINTIPTDVCTRSARALAVGKNYHKNGHCHKARIRATTSTLERRCLVCVFTPTISDMHRKRLMFDGSVGQRSVRETSDAYFQRRVPHQTLMGFSVQLIQIGCNCSAELCLLSLIHSARFSGLEMIPSNCSVSHLANWFIDHIRQTVCHHLPLSQPSGSCR